LPQDPRLAGVMDGRTSLSHILSGRGVDEELVRIEKLRIAMEEAPTDRNVRRFSKAEEEFAARGGYAAGSEARSIAAGLGLGADRLEQAVRDLSGGK
jgi:ATPase subunit of ABC transporter with duplicated ATPase domains